MRDFVNTIKSLKLTFLKRTSIFSGRLFSTRNLYIFWFSFLIKSFFLIYQIIRKKNVPKDTRELINAMWSFFLYIHSVCLCIYFVSILNTSQKLYIKNYKKLYYCFMLINVHKCSINAYKIYPRLTNISNSEQMPLPQGVHY